MKEQNTDRRAALKQAGIVGLGAMFAATMAKAASHATTPAQTEGPFYPVRDQLDKDSDLTKVQGRSDEALGERVLLSGQVLDGTTGAPIAGALVEFWQACASGKYNHPEDPNDAPLDSNFQYWAQVHTDAAGRYSIKTIKPGAYPAEPGWVRPPHIHVKVHKAGYPALTTQLYFAGNEYNGADRILQALTPAQQSLVIVPFSQSGATQIGDWNIYLAHFRGITGDDAVNSLATPEVD